MKRTALVLASILMLVVGCANAQGQPNGGPADVAADLDVPWGIAFLGDGSALIAERDSAVVKRLAAGVVTDAGTVAGVAARGEGGLLGLATAGQSVFAYITTGGDNRVVRMGFDGTQLTAQTPVFTGIPAGTRHDGGRIAFGPDGKLYVATGEAGNTDLAQDKSSLGGKILRINADGSIPGDNPDPKSRGLVVRPPQYPRAGVGFGGPVVGDGVRRRQGRRAEHDPAWRQLWVADSGGSVR